MNFGFLVFPEVEELDIIGPWEIIGIWSKYFHGPQHCFIVSQTDGEITCAKGLRIVSEQSFTTCPQLDYLLIPGGQGTRREVDNLELIAFIQQQAAHCQHLLSVCTGTFLLQVAGLLAGKKATTHWYSLARLRQFPDITVREQRFVRDGNIWTAAGISAGIDMTLAFIAELAGDEVAGKVQLAAEYYPMSVKYGTAFQTPEVPEYITSS
jgi:transcriptional regulator GlxA family with amidase domain